MATKEAKSYSILFYGSPQGYQTNRAQIQLSGSDGKTIAWIRFNDPGMFFENDYESGGIIRMHLPSAMFQNVLDVLRNEKPVKTEVFYPRLKNLSGKKSSKSNIKTKKDRMIFFIFQTQTKENYFLHPVNIK